MSNIVYPIGYSTPQAQERIDELLSANTLLIDTRYSPNSRMPQWAGTALKKRYGEKYRWAGKYLGNCNFSNGGPIKLANPAIGIKRLDQYLRECYDLILLCKCQVYTDCHVSHVVKLLLEKMPDVEIVRQLADTIPCLSIKQPWAWLISNGLKGIENRDRDFTAGYRGPLLLHAGKEVDKDCFVGDEINLDFFERFGSEAVDALPRQKREYALGSFVGQADLVDVVEESDNPWFCGDYGLVLANARLIDPIPYRGALKLFDVPRSILDRSETRASLGPCTVCGEPATLASPSRNPESVYCEKHGYCRRCKRSIEKFVLYHACYVCPCVAAYAQQTSIIEEKRYIKQAKQSSLF